MNVLNNSGGYIINEVLSLKVSQCLDSFVSSSLFLPKLLIKEPLENEECITYSWIHNNVAFIIKYLITIYIDWILIWQ